MSQTLTQSIEVPQLLVNAWKPKKTAQKKIVEAAVLELVREGQLSSGKAAEVLGMSRRDVLDLMSERGVPLANFSPQELARQIKDTRALVR
jgi:predicted HTH domain antitoxin